jgi:hypothetical protein
LTSQEGLRFTEWDIYLVNIKRTVFPNLSRSAIRYAIDVCDQRYLKSAELVRLVSLVVCGFDSGSSQGTIWCMLLLNAGL